MTILRIDSILKAIAIDRDGHQRFYCPSRASMRRILRLTCQAYWLYRPCLQYQIHVWELEANTWKP